MSADRKILVGMIAGAHGVRGDVRLKSFTAEPGDIAKYKPITDESGDRIFTIKLKTATNNYFIASVAGVKGRDEAEGLRGTRLYVARTALPKLRKREFYEADLIGLAARDAKGGDQGRVLAVHNYGGGPFLEIAPPQGAAFMLPFTKECVPEVDMEQGFVTIDPPQGWVEADKPKNKGRKERA